MNRWKHIPGERIGPQLHGFFQVIGKPILRSHTSRSSDRYLKLKREWGVPSLAIFGGFGNPDCCSNFHEWGWVSENPINPKYVVALVVVKISYVTYFLSISDILVCLKDSVPQCMVFDGVMINHGME